ncbi:type II/IV secretion system ATPase subunit [Halohasta litorea]|uniref:Type II/IV secretion system ATPase subunit n=1 Tax=Halohasta litorea TaxID=869891 RepID=A0ABD6D6G6_9EURY|nr:type II/IV secretion system ATPase subunit [Halohasta litorea]MEA1930938.1 type II/IV secretion system ATPase subunit [Euryarchaeota archaeon]
MTEQGTPKPSDELKQMAMREPHLREHLMKFKQITGEFPLFVDEPDDYESRRPNVLYPAGGPIYIHVHGDVGQKLKYYTVEPTLSDSEAVILEKVKRKLLSMSGHRDSPEEESEYDDLIEELLEDATYISDGETNFYDRVKQFWNLGKIEVNQQTYNAIRYRLNRDIVGFGPLEPVMRDTQNEDIHVIGPHECHVDHGTFGMMPTTVDFGTLDEFDSWLRNMGERIGDPVSDSDPIVDSTLPDGSRVNIIYSDDVSIKGPSMTIRQGEGVPLSINQITNWNTLSPRLAAYLWLCLENEQTVFVVGETASGKTTTLNAILSYIPRDAKIYTAEDTAEVLPPHDTWQQLMTREGEEGSEVDMFDLVAAALRSRPDYIIVGEVRGAEGRMAFQAAQTGHPVMLTFHASDIVSMIQRFTSEPINVPETFMDVADVALFQNRVKQGDDVLRRVTSVQEIEGYSSEMDGVVTREAFSWDPVEDEILFQGMNNSYVLEEQIATLLGYADTRDIYDQLDYRAEVIERMIQEGVMGYHEVNETIDAFQRDGVEGLPFSMRPSPVGND